MDYFIGRDIGGIASTHIIFLLVALFGLYITNNNKTNITISSIVSLLIVLFIISLFNGSDIVKVLFNNNYPFIMAFIATDSVTSCYTNKGSIVFGVLVGIITGLITLINPIIAPYIAILIVSLFNILIDKYTNILI
jgi:Na+-translocating ferredoxin:NAD+ oxidoreductase RnfD subunit